VAARAAALPETVGDASLLFTPDDPDDLARTLEAACGFAGTMAERGRRVIAGRTEIAWQQAFAQRVESVLHAEPIRPRVAVAIEPRRGRALRIRAGARCVAVRLANTGSVPLWPDGPCAARLRCRLGPFEAVDTPLPEQLNPGHSV